MRAVVQRVSKAEVQVGGRVVGSIGHGLLTLLGVGSGDTRVHVEKLVSKILKLRIFEDEQGKMNRSLSDIQGGHLIVSQFTLYGDVSKGNRPSFVQAADPVLARELYEHALAFSASHGVKTASGEFQADMKVELVNDGPATFLIEIDGEDFLIVTDSGNSRLVGTDSNLDRAWTYGSEGTGDGQFENPKWISNAGNNRIVVSDNTRVQIFDIDL